MGHATVLIWLSVLTIGAYSINQTEHDLHRTLFQFYNPDVLPVINRSEVIEVSMDLFTIKIDDINEKKQTFSIRGYLQMSWTNDFLKWKPENYDGIKMISVQNKNIWIPDLALSKVYDSPTELGHSNGRTSVNYNGSCVTWPYKLYVVECQLNIRRFPFDIQVCDMEFLSYTLPFSVLKIKTSEKLSFQFYEENTEWALDSYVVKHYQNGYGGDTWDHVLFRFTLRRKWLFHVLNMIVPIVCISLLNLTCFITPSESGERVSLCISIFLTLAVFLTIISGSLPESSDEISLFAIYVGLQLLCSGLTILATIISLHLFYKDTKEPVSYYYRVLSTLFCQATLTKENNAYMHANGRSPTDKDPSEMTRRISCYDVADISWESVSRAFDRMCFLLSFVWNIALAIGLICAFGV